MVADGNRKALVALVGLAIAVGGYFAYSHWSNDGLGQRIGGIDLARYCKSYGYEQNDENRCSSQINLTQACNWQYQATNLVAREENGPVSTLCYTPQKVSRGGISNMLGYCQVTFQGSAGVQAGHEGNTWYCRNDIDPNNVCNWQYQQSGLKARQEGGVWGCYKR